MGWGERGIICRAGDLTRVDPKHCIPLIYCPAVCPSGGSPLPPQAFGWNAALPVCCLLKKCRRQTILHYKLGLCSPGANRLSIHSSTLKLGDLKRHFPLKVFLPFGWSYRTVGRVFALQAADLSSNPSTLQACVERSLCRTSKPQTCQECGSKEGNKTKTRSFKT